jgi:hypothetical protein
MAVHGVAAADICLGVLFVANYITCLYFFFLYEYIYCICNSLFFPEKGGARELMRHPGELNKKNHTRNVPELAHVWPIF